MKTDTFYVIFGMGALKYFSGSFLRWTADRSAAKSYDTMSAVFEAINTDSDIRGPISVRRVTRTTTPGTTKRIVLDHGDAVPAGAEIKFAAMNPVRPLTAETLTQNGPGKLRLWDSEASLNRGARHDEFAGSGDYVVRRVALITTEPTVEYKEEVVQ